MFNLQHAPYFLKPTSEKEAKEWRESVESVLVEYFEAVEKQCPHTGRLRNGMTMGQMALYLIKTEHGRNIASVYL